MKNYKLSTCVIGALLLGRMANAGDLSVSSLKVDGTTSAGTSLQTIKNSGVGDFCDYIINSAVGSGHDLMVVKEGATRKWRLGYEDSVSTGNFRLYNDTLSHNSLTINPTTDMATFAGGITAGALLDAQSADGGTALVLRNSSGAGRMWINPQSSGAFLIYDGGSGSPVSGIAQYQGRVGIGTTSPTNKLHVIGGVTFTSGSGGGNQTVVWNPGDASWSFTSDRNTKDRVTPVDSQAVLEKVTHIPINEWSYIGYPQRHVGPMAQDFHAQFPLNENNLALNDADLHGVALAAIQGLNEKLEGKNLESGARLQKLETENAELKQTVNELKKLVEAMSQETKRGAH